MRKILVIISCFFFAAVLSACGGGGGGSHGDNDSGDDGGSGGGGSDLVNHHPGEIPGLGEYPGELQGMPFVLPQGVMLNGDIRGADYNWLYYTASSSLNLLLSDKENKVLPPPYMNIAQAVSFPENQPYVGSGFDVTVTIPLLNTNPTETTVVFPARLIIKAKSGEYQNGMLLKETRVTIPANTEYAVTLVMYCVNLQRMGSESSAFYGWGVVSNSSLLKDLTDRLVNKKINVEEYDDIVLSRQPWNSPEYYSRYERLADIVWNLTDRGIALSEDDKAWINALPDSN